MAIEIHRVIFEKKQLEVMPRDERSLLMLMGHATNELNVLSKFLLMMRKDDPPTQIEDFAEGGQTFIIMRILIGKLHEAWELFKARAQSNKEISEKYVQKLGDEGVVALKELNTYFGKKNAVTEIRNKVSFHYKDKDDLIEKNFQRLPNTEPWEIYLSKTHGNTLYYMSEMVATGSVLSLVGNIDETERASLADDIKAFSELSKAVLDVSKNITILFSWLISDIVSAYIPDPVVKTEKFEDGPKLSKFALPYFFDEDEEDWTAEYEQQAQKVPTPSQGGSAQ
ncbi:hypothetical protein SSBR45G_52230 [Bradyrhizobium sp. SSBR45G]|uniref:hypothetical protein n=1 Tax=unclassified Bradyrhizobium TaxID=2631580 RepID=UPI0023429CB4|nr:MULTISPECIES: hypothetical protein [unclassified Bradyrhizobium]GLH80314.1 hypothetical protein SSBR45G_52230 [Bradyrhizobium sp. SSBR45G]GLH87808.1 hypothetical protein SSBR45R_52680 [Bradyrhizobium sp. SSBR45R]